LVDAHVVGAERAPRERDQLWMHEEVVESSTTRHRETSHAIELSGSELLARRFAVADPRAWL
jgi:hypothetical protein